MGLTSVVIEWFLSNNKESSQSFSIVKLLELELSCQIKELSEKLISFNFSKFLFIEDYLRIRILFRLGNYSEIFEEIEKILRKDRTPTFMQKIYNAQMQMTRYRIGDYKRAIAESQKIIKEIKVDYRALVPVFRNVIGSAYHDLGQFNKSQAYFIENLANPIDEFQRANTLIGMGDNNVHLGNYDESNEQLREAIIILEKFHDIQHLAYAYHISGILNFYKSDLKLAIDNCKFALDLREILSNPQDIARTNNTIGEIYYNIGDLTLAKTYLHKSLISFEKIGNKRDLSFPYIILALIQAAEKNESRSLEYISKSIELLEEIGNEQDLSSAYTVKGELFEKLGLYQKAIVELEKSLFLKKKFGNPTLTGYSYYNLIISYIHSGDFYYATSYLQEFEILADSSNVKYPTYLFMAIKAYYLKFQKRLAPKVEALEIFEKLAVIDEIEYEHRIFIILNLCDLLLDEIKLFEKKESINKIISHIDIISTISQYNKDYRLYIEVSILRSRLNISQGNLELAHKELENLELEIKSLTTDVLYNKVVNERKKLQKNLDRWMKNLQTSTDMNELLLETKAQDYLKEIAKHFEHDKI